MSAGPAPSPRSGRAPAARFWRPCARQRREHVTIVRSSVSVPSSDALVAGPTVLREDEIVHRLPRQVRPDIGRRPAPPGSASGPTSRPAVLRADGRRRLRGEGPLHREAGRRTAAESRNTRNASGDNGGGTGAKPRRGRGRVVTDKCVECLFYALDSVNPARPAHSRYGPFRSDLRGRAWPDSSQRRIAQQVGCTQQYVSKVRAQVITSYHLPDRVVGTDGHSYPAVRSAPSSPGDSVSSSAPPANRASAPLSRSPLVAVPAPSSDPVVSSPSSSIEPVSDPLAGGESIDDSGSMERVLRVMP